MRIARVFPAPPTPAGAVLLGLLLGCGPGQTEPERLFDAGHDRIEQGDDSGGVALLQQVLDEYPESPQAASLRQNWSAYQELLVIEAERLPVAATRDLRRMGQALERRRQRGNGYPQELAALVPQDLDAVPLDPWGRPYAYRRRGAGYVLETLGADGAAGGDGADRDIRLVDGILHNAAAAGLQGPG